MDSYVPADDKKIRHALDMLMAKYHNTLAPIVAEALGYDYDNEEAENVMVFICEQFSFQAESRKGIRFACVRDNPAKLYRKCRKLRL